MRTRWLTGPLQKISPWLKPLVTLLTDLGKVRPIFPAALFSVDARFAR